MASGADAEGRQRGLVGNIRHGGRVGLVEVDGAEHDRAGLGLVGKSAHDGELLRIDTSVEGLSRIVDLAILRLLVALIEHTANNRTVHKIVLSEILEIPRDPASVDKNTAGLAVLVQVRVHGTNGLDATLVVLELLDHDLVLEIEHTLDLNRLE